MDLHSSHRKLGYAWLGLATAVALHVIDEALTGFLSVYNPTVIELRDRWGWFPMPVFSFDAWIGGLAGAVLILFSLSPLAFGNARGIRPVAYLLCIVMIGNAAGHTLATILGRTVNSVQFPRPAPGFYSSPLLLIASLYLIVQLRGTAGAAKATAAAGVR